MRPAQRVESQAAVPLLETYTSCLGITIVDSYLYVFYSNTIRVYEHFYQKFMPQLSQELIVSQRKIVRFAVNSRYIAMLFDDSKIQIRSREHWERVQYSFNLAEAAKIGKFSLTGNMIVYQYFDEQAKCDTYGFVSLNQKSKENPNIQTMLWATPTSFTQMTHLKELGNIENFFFGLVENQIKFGTYYKLEDTQKLQSFEFGSIKQENRLNKVLFFSILSLPIKRDVKDQSFAKNLYIVKLIDENKEVNNKLLLKYRKFYQHLPAEKQDMDSEQKRVEAYTKMMNTLVQINSSKIEQQNNALSNSMSGSELNQSRDSQSSKHKSGRRNKSIEIILQKDEKFYNFIERNEFLYFSTNQRVFKFSITQDDGEMNGKIQQILNLDKDSRFIEACQNNLYITVPNICVTNCGEKFQTAKVVEPVSKKEKQEGQSVEVQTESLNDIMLDQMQEKQFNKMMDNLLQKKQVIDIETQTQPQAEISISSSEDKIEVKVESKPIQPTKSYNQISIGGALPMCPDSHEETLRKINNNLLQIQNNIHRETIKKLHQFIIKQQNKTKQSIEKKVQQLVGTAISNSVIPAIQTFIRQVFEAKLQEVNVYLYSLTMENLLLLKQEIQKDQAKENALRIQLIKRQLYEVSESKKAVAQMVEICKKKEIQKIVFFEEVKKKFVEISKKVQSLEEKVKTMIQGQSMNEAKLYDEIDIIKTMLKCQGQKNQIPNRKKSTISQDKEQKNQAQDEISDKSSEDQESEQESQSQSDEGEVTSSIEETQTEQKSRVVTKRHQIPQISHPAPYPYEYRSPYPYPPNYNHYPPYQSPMPPMPPQYMPYHPPGGYGYEMGPRLNPNYNAPRMAPMSEFMSRQKNLPVEKQQQKRKHRKKER